MNLDQALYTAIVKAKVYGKAGFEIVRDAKGEPAQMFYHTNVNFCGKCLIFCPAGRIKTE